MNKLCSVLAGAGIVTALMCGSGPTGAATLELRLGPEPLPGVKGEGAGRVQLRIFGEPGSEYLIQTSPNLVTWTDVATVTLAGGSAEIPAPLQEQKAALFYRALRVDGGAPAVPPFASISDEGGRMYVAFWQEGSGFGDLIEVARLHGVARGPVIGDFDRDGIQDLVLGGSNGPQILPYFLKGREDSTFGEPVALTPTGDAGNHYMGAAAADFDVDGRLDFVTGGNSGTVGFYWGNGDGTFVQEARGYPGAGRDIDTGDFNGDGIADFVRATCCDGLVRLYLSNGDRTFTAAAAPVGDAGDDPYGVAAGDFNEDGYLDVIADAGSGGAVTFFPGRGDGTFDAGRPLPELDIDNYGAMDAYDYDGDGHLDIVLSAYTSQRVYFWPGRGDATFGPRTDLASRPVHAALGLAAPPISDPLDVGIEPVDPIVALLADVGFHAVGADVAAPHTIDWTFGDGAEGQGKDIIHAFAEEGVVVTRLRHVHPSGVITRRGTVVTVEGAPPVADAGGPYALGEAAANQAKWTAAVSGAASSDDFAITDYAWDWGDGAVPGTGQAPTHTWAGQGPWPVRLTVTDAAGQQAADETTVTFTPGAAPVARITAPDVADETYAAAGVWTVRMSGAQSTDDVGLWKHEWNFGNGQTASGADVTASYAAEGWYTITLTVTDHAGQTNVATHLLIVTANNPPLAAIAGPDLLDEAAAQQGKWSGAWDASASSDDTAIYKYEWDFGDGSAKVSGPQQAVTHQYAAPGTYLLTLTVYDNGNLTGSHSIDVVVAGNELPVPAIDLSPAQPEGAQPVTLSAARSTDDFGIWYYRWHLPPRLFTFAGTEPPYDEWKLQGARQDDALFITGPSNWGQTYAFLTSTRFARGAVLGGVVATPTQSPAHAMIGFKNLDFGSGHYTTLVYALYFNNGELRIYQGGGDYGRVGAYTPGEAYEFRIETLPGSGAKYFVRPLGSPDPLALIYETGYASNDSFLIGMDVYSQTFGFDDLRVSHGFIDGMTVTTPVYPGGEVRLEVVDHAAQAASATVAVNPRTGAPPQAVITTAPDPRPGPRVVTFDGSHSSDDVGIASYSWDFGDGSLPGFGPQAAHYFGAPGTYTVRLTVYDFAGQIGTAEVAVVVGQAPAVIAVPWRFVGSVEIPHETWTGREITLKAVAENMPLPFDYEWRFGDGTQSFNGTATSAAQAFALEAKHTYGGSPGTPFRATITVIDAGGNRFSDVYPVIVRDKSIEVEMNVAIDEGLWYLHKVQNRYDIDASQKGTYWTFGGYTHGITASAVHAFAINGHLETGDPAADPYVVDVMRGMNYLLGQLYSAAIGMQAHGDPDANGNGIALFLRNAPTEPYQLGQVMDAFVAAGAPDLPARLGGADVINRPYKDLVQDMADTYSWGQSDYAQGGWRYSWNADIDNSAAQWGAIGYVAGEQHYGTVVPQWVKEQNRAWVEYSRGGSGFGYGGPGDGYATTASALVQLAWQGLDKSDPLWRHGEDYLARSWDDYIRGNNLYLFYALVKAMRLAQPSPVITFQSNGFDWYLDPQKGLVRTLLGRQDPGSGSWLSDSWITERPYSTAWAVIMLSSALFRQAPVGIILAQPNPAALGQPVLLDATESYHQDPFFSIVKYSWDFDLNDGVDFENPDATGPVVTHAYPELTTYTVSLRVEDNNIPPSFDVTTVDIVVSVPPHPPTADAGGPYVAAVGEDIWLDGSASFDVDEGLGDSIHAWDWELDFEFPLDFDDGVSGESALLAGGLDAPGTYDLGLRVTDSTVAVFPQAGSPDLTDDAFTTILIYPPLVEDLLVRSKLIKNQLVWTQVGDLAVVQRSDRGPNRGFVEIGRTDSDYATFLDEDVAPGSLYYYRILFYQNGNLIGGSRVVSAFAGEPGGENGPPAFVSQPRNTAVVGQPYAYPARAEDPEGGALLYTLRQAPVDMTIDTHTGLIEYTPAPAALGQYQVLVRATDPEGLFAEQIYPLNVVPDLSNLPPIITSQPGTVGIVGGPYVYLPEATDPNGHAVTWSLDRAPAGMLLDAATPALRWTPAITQLGPNEVSLRATDTLGAFDVQTFTIQVRTNVAPQAQAGADQTVKVGDRVQLDGTASSDADGDPITYAWSFVERPAGSAAALSDPTAATPSFVADAHGPFVLQLIVSDGFANSAPDQVRIAIQNRKPVANAGFDRVLEIGANVQLDGSLSFDDDADPLTFSWVLAQKPAGSAAVLANPTAVNPSFVADIGGVYVARLVVHDGFENSDPDTVTITVNRKPLAAAGADQALFVGDQAQLDGSASSDPDGDALTYRWAFAARPAGSAAAFSDPAVVAPTFLVDAAGEYIVQLVVNDTKQDSDPDTVRITTVNRAPIADAGPDSVFGPGQDVVLDGTGSSDPDGDALTYAWRMLSRPAGSAAELAGATSVTPSFHADAYGDFVIELVARDGALASAPDTVTITIANTPPVADAGPDQVVDVGATVQLTGAQSSDPNGDPISYAWTLASRPFGSAAVLSDASAARPTFVADLAGEYVARLVVTDGRDPSAPDEVRVTAVLPPVTVPDVLGMTQAAAVAAIQAAGLAVGTIDTAPDDAVPAGLVAAQAPAGGSVVPGGTAVNIIVSAGALIDITPPTIGVTALPEFVNVGEPVTITVTAADDAGPITRSLTVNGADVPLDAAGQAGFVPLQAGLYTAAGRAVDAAGLEARDEALFRARSGQDNGPPTVALTGPPEDTVISVPADLTGSATDSDFAFYELQAAPAGSGEFSTFHTSLEPVTNAALGQVDPQMFVPGMYDVRVCAEDAWGNRACSQARTYELSAATPKSGMTRLAFLDGFVQVSGIPISIWRIYDSRTKQAGDFGRGWTLEADAVKLQANRPMGEDWQQQKFGGFFPTYQLVATEDHKVTVTMPDGTSHRFRMRPNPQSQLLFPIQYLDSAIFDPLPGTTARLDALGQPEWIDGGPEGPVTILDGNFEVYNPSGYLLTLVDGRKLTFLGSGGALQYELDSIQDTNGNTVWFEDDRIVHSAGASVGMRRDAQGRIDLITDPDGNTRSYEYDARGNLVGSTDYEGFETTYVYDNDSNLIQVIDPRGHIPGTLVYDEQGRIAGVIDANGNRVALDHDDAANQDVLTDRMGNTTVTTYDDRGNAVSIVDALGNETTFTYDANDNLTSQTDPLGNKWEFTYDAGGQMLTRKDPLGNVTTRTYDAAGNLTAETDPLGRTFTFEYDAAGNQTAIVNPRGGRVERGYDAAGNVTRVVDPAGDAVDLQHDAQGRVTSFTDPLGRQTSVEMRSDGQIASESFLLDGNTVRYDYEYDANGNVRGLALPNGARASLEYNAASFPTRSVNTLGLSQSMTLDSNDELASFTDYDGGVTTVDRDLDGRITRAVDPRGLLMERDLDALGRPDSVRTPSGLEVKNVYDAAGRVIRQSRTGMGETTFEYDAAGRPIRSIAGDGGVTTFEYDAASQMTAMVDPLGARTEFIYDASGNVARTDLPGGASVKTEFDLMNRITAIEDERGARLEFTYDAAGQVDQVKDTAGGITEYAYDDAGNMSTARTPGGSQWAFTHNAMGNMLSRTFPWGGTEEYELDAAGGMTRITDPTGAATTFEYDAAGQVTRRVLADGTDERYTFDAGRQLVSAVDGAGETRYAYAPNGRPNRVDYPDGTFVEYQYNAANQITSLRTPAGVTAYTYDAQGRLTGVADSQLGDASYEYDLADQLVKAVLPDGSTTTYTRDARGWVTRIRTVAANGTAVIRDDQIAYDAGGNPTAVTGLDQAATYGYDQAGRLVSEARTGPDTGALDYVYDADWNLTRIGTRAISYDGSMRLADDGRFTYTYDAAGRPVSRASAQVTEQFSYDSLARLVRVDRQGAAPAVVTLEYNHAGLLSRIEADGVGRSLLWDVTQPIPQLLEERDDAGGLLRRYVYGMGPVGLHDGAARILHQDTLGTIRMVTAAGGNVLAQYGYTAYGEHTSGAADLTSRLRFAGEQYIPELGMYYMRSRFYDPGTGRFWTPDIFPTRAQQPQSFNPYLYANANPVRFKDPLGHFTLGQVTIAITIINIVAAIALPHFSSPVLMVAKALGLTQADAQVGISLALTIAYKWASGGFQLDFLYGPKLRMVVVWIFIGGEVGSVRGGDPRITTGPFVSFWMGSIYGAANSEPSEPRGGIYLGIGGSVARIVIEWATSGKNKIGRNDDVKPNFARGAGLIQFEIVGYDRKGEIGSTFFQAFSIYGSWWENATLPPVKSKFLDARVGRSAWSAGIGFWVYLPIGWFSWGGEQIEGDWWFSTCF